MNKLKYYELKEQARDEAKDFQYKFFTDESMSYEEIIIYQNKFERLAKKYGLIKEFRLNGII